MKSQKVKDQAMSKTKLQNNFYEMFISHRDVYPRVSNIHSDKSIVKIDHVFQGGTNWIAFFTSPSKSPNKKKVGKLISVVLVQLFSS